jgi:Sec-independent protein translocase protein TatA
MLTLLGHEEFPARLREHDDAARGTRRRRAEMRAEIDKANADKAKAQAEKAKAQADLEAEKANALAATRAIAEGLLADGMAREKVEAIVKTPLTDLGL